MRKSFKYSIIISLLLITSIFYGQKNGIAYQALIFMPGTKIYPAVSPLNTPLIDTPVCLRFTFLDVIKNVEYQEIIKVSTDSYGIVNTTIGSGQQVGGYVSLFDDIVWNGTSKTLLVELDISGACLNFDEISNEALSAVPYSNKSGYASTVGTNANLNGDVTSIGNTTTIAAGVVTTSKMANNAITPVKIASGGSNKVLVTDVTGAVSWMNKTDLASSSTTAISLQGTPVSTTAPSIGQFLRYDGTAWVPVSTTDFIRTSILEFSSGTGTTSFALPTSYIGVTGFFINGIRVPKDAISITGNTLTYNATNNGSYNLMAGDRIAIDYIY